MHWILINAKKDKVAITLIEKNNCTKELLKVKEGNNQAKTDMHFRLQEGTFQLIIKTQEGDKFGRPSKAICSERP